MRINTKFMDRISVGVGLRCDCTCGDPMGRFRELLLVLSSLRLSCGTRGCVCGSCMRGVVLHADGAWPLEGPGLRGSQRNGGAVVGQVCSVKSEDVAAVGSEGMLAQLWIGGLNIVLGQRGLMLNAPVVQSRQPATYR